MNGSGASSDGVGDILAELRRFGAYFTVTGVVGEPGFSSGSGEWASMEELYRPGTVLDELTRTVQGRLGDCEPRVAASILHLGVAARLLSPQIGGLCLGRCGLDLSIRNTRWRTTDANFFELGMLRPRVVAATSGDGSIAALMREHLLPLSRVLGARFHLVKGLLMGNLASAAVGAFRVLSPHLGPGWAGAARQLLTDAGLSGTGGFQAREPVFVRRSCCLFYRTSAGGFCGDCPIPSRRSPNGLR